MKQHYTAEEALALLKEGNERFVTGQLKPKNLSAEDRQRLLEGQHPYAVILCCSDSRVAPELLFDSGLGELFVIRNAGNVVDEAVLGSIEYATEHLGTPLVVVLGHTCCGAVTATCEGGELPGNIQALAKRIRPSISTTCSIDENALRHARRMAQEIADNPVVQHLGVRVVVGMGEVGSGEWNPEGLTDRMGGKVESEIEN